MLTVVHLITGLETGGAEGMLARLAIRSDRSRFRSIVVSMTDAGTIGPRITASGIALHTLQLRRGFPDPRGVLRLRRILRAARADILQTWLYHADLLGLAASRLGLVPHLVWNVRCSESVGSRVVRRLLARWSKLPDRVVVNSLEGRRFHEALGYRPQCWEYLPNGFDPPPTPPDRSAARLLRAQLGIADTDIAILLPARYHPMKDHVSFLAAAARLAATDTRVRFVLVGAGTTDNPVLAELIAKHGLVERVHALGERRDLDALYPLADIVTLSSAFGEGFPNVLGEAMGCGVPCVATDTGDCAAIIGDTGLVVPPRDPVALAAAWQRLTALDAAERQALGERARARILAHYRLDAIVSRYESLYEAIAADRTVRVVETSRRQPEDA